MGLVNVALVSALWLCLTSGFLSSDTVWDLGVVTFLVLIAQPLVFRRQAEMKPRLAA